MRPRSRFGVAAQIGAGFFVAVALLAIVASIAVNRATVIRALANEAAALAGVRSLTSDVLVQMLAEESDVRAYAASGDAAYLSAMRSNDGSLTADLATLDKSDQTDAVDSSRLEQIDLETESIESDIAAVKKSWASESKAKLKADAVTFARLRRDADALLSYSTAQARAASGEFDRALYSLVAILVWSAIGAIVVLIGTASFIGGSIARRLAQVTQALRSIAERDIVGLTNGFDRLSDGDLSATFELDRPFLVDEGHDEIAGLAESYNAVVSGLELISIEFGRMTGRLREMMTDISDAASDIASAGARMAAATGESTAAVEQIAVSIGGVAEDAREQAVRLLSASGQIDDLSRGAVQIAAGSSAQERASFAAVETVRHLDEQISAFASLGTMLSKAAAHAKDEAESGQASVSQTADSMQRLKDATGIAQEAMASLEARSSAVSNIVSVIDDMADQTNLLALNAAIEAARAGDQGKGFAVVADEVRRLAEKSRTSTREISKILDAIRQETLRAVDAIASASQQMDAGLNLSVGATNALGAVGTAIAETAAIACEVADRSNEMRAASTTLTQSIASMSRVIEENTSVAGGVRRTSEEVLVAIHPVSEFAEHQAETAREVASAVSQLSVQIQEMDASSALSHAQSELLRRLVRGFRIAAVFALAIACVWPHAANATPTYARRTLLSCGACHSVGIVLTPFGKIFKANGYVVPKLIDRGDVPVSLQAQSAYFGDPDTTGLPKLIVDKVILLAGGPVAPHVNVGAEQYILDGGVLSALREGWVEYSSSWKQRVPFDGIAGLQVLPLPTDPERFKLSEQDYLIYDQSVGANPFTFYGPMYAVRVSLGKELRGLNVSVLALDNHDQSSPFSQTGTDWMLAAQQTYKNFNLEAYRYDGRRALPGADVFWRQGFGANYYLGRLTIDGLLQTGNDSNPLNTGTQVASSGGYLQAVYQLGHSGFSYLREDGVNDTTGNFRRDFVMGQAFFIGRSFKVEIENVVTHTPRTHNSLAVILGVGVSTIHKGSAAY